MNTPVSLRGLSVIAALVLSAMAPLSAHAQPKNYLIKGSGAAVYFNADDGKRYVFPNESVFKSWYPSPVSIAQIDDATLASIQLGGNVTYRPGATLVKITTDPRVYAVSRYGMLHWVTSEAVASALYGADWNKKVVDVPDTFFTNYVVSYQITDAAQYASATELASAVTPSDNMKPFGFNPSSVTPPTVQTTINAPTLDLSISTSQAVLNQAVSIFATVTNASSQITRIDIREASSQTVLATCQNSLTCSYVFTVAKAPFAAIYTADVTDAAGHTFTVSPENRPSLKVNSTSDQIRVSAMPLTAVIGSRVSLSSDATGLGSITSHKIYALILGQATPVLWFDCKSQTVCASSSPLYRTTSFFSEIVTGGQTFDSASVNVVVTGGDAPKPTISVIGHPAKNQIEISINPPVGETIGVTSLVDGTTIDKPALALCNSSCSVVVQVSVPGSLTAFTWVGGKYEPSNTLTVVPE